MSRRADEVEAEESTKGRKRKGEKDKKSRKNRKCKKLKYARIANELEKTDLELIEQLETAKTMFLNTNLSEAPIDTVKSQTMIQIWSALEVAAMDMLRDMAGRWSR